MELLPLPLMALTAIWNIFIPVLAVDYNCDYYWDLAVGKQYYLQNKEFPSKYKSSTNCRWIMRSSNGTKIVLSCNVEMPLVNHQNPFFNLHPNNKCEYQDKVIVSSTGKTNLGDGHTYCGNGTFSTLSVKNSMSVALLSTSDTKGGRFFCSVAAIQITSPAVLTPDTQAVGCDCGWRYMNKIVGGTETGQNEYPSMAGIIWLEDNSLLCGATIISDRYLLTAAHCVYNRDPSLMNIRVGFHDITSGTTSGVSALYSVSAYEAYPGYVQNSDTNDIAIIQTAGQMVFGLKVAPICLPFRYTGYAFYGETVTVLGWGSIEFTGPWSDVLLEAQLKVITNLECSQSSPTVTAASMCAYAAGKDACQGDSGGPLLWTDVSTNRMHLVGIISQGTGCASTLPSVNTRVSTYLSWVVSRTSDAAYCIM